MRPRSRGAGSAFTLVEIVLALGLIAFALTGVFGLLSAAATSTGQSDRDTMVVTMSTQVLNNLRAAPFDALWEENPARVATMPGQPVTHGSTAPADSLFYFSGEGAEASDSSSPGTVYFCRVRKTVDRDRTGYEATTIENALELRLIFSWPVAAPEAKRQYKTIYAKIARY